VLLVPNIKAGEMGSTPAMILWSIPWPPPTRTRPGVVKFSAPPPTRVLARATTHPTAIAITPFTLRVRNNA
jgi:hypothetical protein